MYFTSTATVCSCSDALPGDPEVRTACCVGVRLCMSRAELPGITKHIPIVAMRHLIAPTGLVGHAEGTSPGVALVSIMGPPRVVITISVLRPRRNGENSYQGDR